jgi:hypothetical protein
MKHLTILLIAVMAGVAWGHPMEYEHTHLPLPAGYQKVKIVSPDSIVLTDWKSQPITAGLLEEFLADTSTMDSVYIDWGAAMRDKSGELKWGPRWISPPYPKTLPGLLAWIKRKYKEK